MSFDRYGNGLAYNNRTSLGIYNEDARDDGTSLARRTEFPPKWRHPQPLPGSSFRPIVGSYTREQPCRVVAGYPSKWQQPLDWNASHGHSTRFQPSLARERVHSTYMPVGMVPVGFDDADRLPRTRVGESIRRNSPFEGNRSTTMAPRRTLFASCPRYIEPVIPRDIVIPESLRDQLGKDDSPSESIGKRGSNSMSPDNEHPKRQRTDPGGSSNSSFDKLELLCSATLELGPLQDNPAGCSCPKSKCIALYCDCFKAGRRCDKTTCTCLDCKNTIAESGVGGARSKAIKTILARNPRAFVNAGEPGGLKKVPEGEHACNCIRSRCLKLYCTCFQAGRVCNPSICSCVGCLNTESDVSGMRRRAVQATLEKRPDAFSQKKKVKDIGSGCACKNNRCVRKYCECFRTGLICGKNCSCKECLNIGTAV